MPVAAKPSQDFIPIRDIKNGVVILNNGELRMILMTSTLNFGLKSSDEQAAIIMQFQNYLNSLEFPTQIFVQSKRLDIRPYLKLLEEREQAQLIDAMKIQIHEYISFVRDFTDRSNIMSKNFFVVIPYAGGGVSLGSGGGKGLLGSLLPGKSAQKKPLTKDEEQSFEESRLQLEQRVAIVEQGLARCDIRTTRLGTEEITELFYRKFNPGELDSGTAD